MRKLNLFVVLIVLSSGFIIENDVSADENRTTQETKKLIKSLSTEKISHIKAGIIEKLGNLKAKESVPEIIKALKDENWSVRAQACISLGKIGDKRAVPHLIERLKDKKENWSIQVKSAESLSNLQDPSSFQPLVEILLYETEIERKIKDLVPPPRHIYSTPDEHVERIFSEVLKSFVEKSKEKDIYISSLQKYITNKKFNDIFRYRIAIILGQWGEKSSVPILIECLEKCKRGELRIMTAALLGELGVKESIPLLKQALNDDYLLFSHYVSEDIGRGMIENMKLIEGKEIFSSLKLEKDINFEGRVYYKVYHFVVRDAAAGALKELGIKVIKEGNGYKVVE
ncbi:MAG: HEAT repeat domain-containing protein [bacterium]